MELMLGNPWGLLGLLSIPLIVAIHFLQRQNRHYEISTLFLVPVGAMQARRGSKFEFWRNSLSFWLQILAALLLTLMLSMPRWIRADFQQQVILIYDASVSMQAFETEADQAIAEISDEFTKLSKRTSWVLMSSDPRVGQMYRGDDWDAFIAAARGFQSTSGTHSFEAAYRLAEELDDEQSNRILLLTDHIPESLPPHVELYAVGRVIENVGFAGVRVETDSGSSVWRATVRNYAEHPVQLKWLIETPGQPVIEAGLSLDARSTKVLTGKFPTGESAVVRLTLPEDGFAADNSVTILKPKRKQTSYAINGADAFRSTFAEMIQTISDARPALENDVIEYSWLQFEGGRPYQSETAYSFQFRRQEPTAARVQGYYVVEQDPLMDGLNWNALSYQSVEEQFELESTDRVLLWHQELPLIVLREDLGGRDLIVNFDPMRSNALRLPAFLILLNRAVEWCDAELPLAHRDNFESNQSLGIERIRFQSGDQLELQIGEGEGAERLPLLAGHVVRAPFESTIMRVLLNGQSLLDAAVYFAESRESDFKDAATQADLKAQNQEVMKRYSEDDFFAELWMMLLLAALILNWYFIGKGR